jgi:peroxiredoxin
MAATPPVCDFGWKAPDFRLPATDGRTLSLADIAGPKGTLVMFICNHCPYVLGAMDRIIAEAKALQAMGIGVAAICSNDARTHPEDGFGPMKDMAEKQGFPFPYLHDEAQDGRARMGRGLHAGFLRAQRGGRIAVSRPARRCRARPA